MKTLFIYDASHIFHCYSKRHCCHCGLGGVLRRLLTRRVPLLLLRGWGAGEWLLIDVREKWNMTRVQIDSHFPVDTAITLFRKKRRVVCFAAVLLLRSGCGWTTDKCEFRTCALELSCSITIEPNIFRSTFWSCYFLKHIIKHLPDFLNYIIPFLFFYKPSLLLFNESAYKGRIFDVFEQILSQFSDKIHEFWF